ncbi:hypothetical protein [Bifidobacterium aquikefiri]|uniref:hypothetical protein n=1 Tax=Bifidobacterium aquikefiri TaxID=1653207 RepID=UPI0039E9A77E
MTDDTMQRYADYQADEAVYNGMAHMEEITENLERVAEELHGIKEQLRIGNLIQLNIFDGGHQIHEALYKTDGTSFDDRENLGLKTNIAEALGIKETNHDTGL